MGFFSSAQCALFEEQYTQGVPSYDEHVSFAQAVHRTNIQTFTTTIQIRRLAELVSRPCPTCEALGSLFTGRCSPNLAIRSTHYLLTISKQELAGDLPIAQGLILLKTIPVSADSLSLNT
jgi:hypothetical protein